MVDITAAIGLVAAVFLTAALIPQVYRTWKTKHVHGLSWGWMICLFIGFSLFFVYGVLIDDFPLKLMNSVSWVSICCLIVMKITYK